MQLRIVDLFCGCGGFALGAHHSGFSPSISFDIDANLTSSIKRNFPGTELVLADLKGVNGTDVQRQIGGRVDGLFGGPPCQAFSSIGQRRADDPRRSLLGQYYRLVAELEPTFFVMENVEGLGFKDARPVLDDALGMVPSRYKLFGPVIFDAADFGAATRRRRLFVIGYDPEYVDEIRMDDFADAKEAPSSVRDAIADLSDSAPIGEDDGFDAWRLSDQRTLSPYAAAMRSEDLCFTGHRKTIHRQEVSARFASVAQGDTDSVGRHPRLHWERQCPTLRAGTGSDRGSFQSVRPLHPVEPRVITVREAARLQGFPDSFRFHPTVWHSFRMIGNSVSPIIARKIFGIIASRMGVSEGRKVAAE